MRAQVCDAPIDSRYGSGRCRQRANRARHASTDIDKQIAEARRHYWELIRRKAQAQGVSESQVLTAESQLVTADGDVFMHDEYVGHTTPHRPGWAGRGLEAAGPPWSPPPYRAPLIDPRSRLHARRHPPFPPSGTP